MSHGVRDLISSFHNNSHDSVWLLDFFYYSICVSTTVSFGDIAPNNGWTRFLAIAELLLCVLLLAVLLDGVAKKVNNGKWGSNHLEYLFYAVNTIKLFSADA